MWLSTLAYPGAAGRTGGEICVTFPADLAAEVRWKMYSASLGDLAGEVNVTLGLLGIDGEFGFRLLEENVYPF